MSALVQQKEVHKGGTEEITPMIRTSLRCIFLEKAWHLVSSLYVLLSQKVNSEEKCYTGQLLASKEVAIDTEVSKS